jgi:polysaccharide biosynthesis/export protein
MKSKSVLYQLLLERVNQYSAIALSLFLATASLPAIAEESTIKLQDTDSAPSPSETEGVNYRELPELENRETPELDPIETTSPIPAENTEFATQETDYTLGAGDQITLNIFQVEEYSGQYPVLVDGTISLPLVGRVNVNGLTLKETSEIVSKQYSTYLKRPIITVGLVAPRPLKIGVSGEVDNPGSYEVVLGGESGAKFPTVSDMIKEAGGINTIADVRNVRVRRNIKGKEVVFNSNLWNLLTRGEITQDVSLRDGDTIFVPTANEINTNELNRLSEASFGLQTDKPIKVAIVGEVYRPGSHTVQPEQLGNNNAQEQRDSSPPRLTQAIAIADGIKPLANVKKIEVRRTAWDGTEKLIPVDLWELLQSGDTNQDIILQEGDKIVVPKAEALAKEDSEALAAASFNRQEITVNVVGEVKAPGSVQVPPNTPLNQAILKAGGFDTQRANQGDVELVRLNPDGTVDKRQIKIDLAAGIDEEQNPNLRHNDVVVVGRSGLTKTTDSAGSVLNPLGGLVGILRLFTGF